MHSSWWCRDKQQLWVISFNQQKASITFQPTNIKHNISKVDLLLLLSNDYTLHKQVLMCKILQTDKHPINSLWQWVNLVANFLDFQHLKWQRLQLLHKSCDSATCVHNIGHSDHWRLKTKELFIGRKGFVSERRLIEHVLVKTWHWSCEMWFLWKPILSVGVMCPPCTSSSWLCQASMRVWVRFV